MTPGYLLLLGLALLSMCGCQCTREHSYTYNLWRGGTFHKEHAAAPVPNLTVTEAAAEDDFAISYDELAVQTGEITRRSYLLRQNANASRTGQKPVFLRMPLTNGVPMPVNPSQPVLPRVTSTNSIFTIHTAAADIGPHDLPAYGERSGTPAKVVLTPLAVVGDATILSFILALEAALNPNNWIR